MVLINPYQCQYHVASFLQSSWMNFNEARIFLFACHIMVATTQFLLRIFGAKLPCIAVRAYNLAVSCLSKSGSHFQEQISIRGTTNSRVYYSSEHSWA